MTLTIVGMVTSYTCAFSATSCQNVCCENLLDCLNLQTAQLWLASFKEDKDKRLFLKWVYQWLKT